MKDKVSIIIPIYNVEKYLPKCIESIISQTYTNLEIILVNDESPDNSLEICNDYKSKDKRIIVINKKNGGLSDARNVGIKRATGKWITFVDSDDYVDNDYIETLLNLTMKNNSEIGIVLPTFVTENDYKKRYTFIKYTKVMGNKEALIELMYQKRFDTSAWGKIYLTKLFDNVEFPYGKLYEDISTIYKVILKSKKVAFSNEKKYMYLQRQDSIMGRSFKSKDLDYVYQAEDMYNQLSKLKDKNIQKAAKCRLLNANFSLLLKIGNNPQFLKEKQTIYFNIKKYRKEVLFDKNARIKTRIAIMLSYFNFF